MKKTTVGLIFGGKSAEHEISLQSARNVFAALDPEKYKVILIGIDHEGHWLLQEATDFLLQSKKTHSTHINKSGLPVALFPQCDGVLQATNGQIFRQKIDVAFPILHGPFGEDGALQGLLKLANVPFVGSSVLGSAIGMDKDATKRLLRDAGIPIPKFIAVHAVTIPSFQAAVERLGLPLFVKPANLGSSVGVSKVKGEQDFLPAVQLALSYDRKIIIEEAVLGREIECSVLGNVDPIASLPGEIIPQHEFYSYDAKYRDEHGATLKIPANLSVPLLQRIQHRAIQTFTTLCCEGLARVDFFLTPQHQLLVNEINTLPGFTAISMVPKLWEASGIPSSALVDRLIRLSVERFHEEQNLKTSVRTEDVMKI